MSQVVHAPAFSESERIRGWFYFLFELLALPSLLPMLGKALALSNTIVNFCFFALNFLAVCLIFHWYLTNSVLWAFRHPAALIKAVVFGLIGYQVSMYAVNTLLLVLDPSFANVNDASITAMAASNPTLMLIGTVFLAPTAEETLFRGLLFGELHRKNRYAACLLSAAVFSAVHVAGYVGKFPAMTLLCCFAQYLPAGLILAGSFRFSGTVLAPILIHTIINAMSIAALS